VTRTLHLRHCTSSTFSILGTSTSRTVGISAVSIFGTLGTFGAS
jgi:hypothetical protein